MSQPAVLPYTRPSTNANTPLCDFFCRSVQSFLSQSIGTDAPQRYVLRLPLRLKPSRAPPPSRITPQTALPPPSDTRSVLSDLLLACSPPVPPPSGIPSGRHEAVLPDGLPVQSP